MPRRAFDSTAPRKPTNVSVNQDLLRLARHFGINLSRALEARLEEEVREAQRRRWIEENREALAAYNERVERDGVFSDGLRRF